MVVILVIVDCVFVWEEEKNLRQRISELLKYRRNGITKLEGLCVSCVCILYYDVVFTESAEFDVLAQEQEKLQESKVCPVSIGSVSHDNHMHFKSNYSPGHTSRDIRVNNTSSVIS